MNGADTAWMLMATALVLLMTPALGFFYGGIVRGKNALNTLMMSVAALGFVGVAWALVGYSLAFAPGNGLIGDLSNLGLRGVGLEPQGTIPHVLFMAYQGTFAIITAALISGAVVERMRFSAYLAFISLWSLVVYAPVAHWVWGGGFLSTLGALDFAGGDRGARQRGAAALVAAVIVGPRADYGRQAMLPHNVPFTLLGTGLLWFGWFGFNAGSALAASHARRARLRRTRCSRRPRPWSSWTLLDLARTGPGDGGRRRHRHRRRPGRGHAGRRSTSGRCRRWRSARSPRCRATSRSSSGRAPRLDDSLDVVAAHGLGGIVGALLTGVFAQKAWGSTAAGADRRQPRPARHPGAARSLAVDRL